MNAHAVRRGSLAFAFAFALLPVGAVAADGILLAVGPDFEFAAPQVDSSGHHAVLGRRRLADAPQPAPLCSGTIIDGRLLTVDLGASCGNDVLREVFPEVYPPGAYDPTITADGSLFAWRRSTSSPALHQFWFGALDLSSSTQMTPDDASDDVGQLEISPTGGHVVYWRRTGAVQGIARRPAQSSSPVETVDQGASLALNAVHSIDDSGTVYYTKLVGAAQEVHSAAISASPVQLALGSGDKSRACVSGSGALLACVRRIASIDNVVVMNTSGPPSPVQLTSNTSPQVRISALDIARDGATVVFASNGDLAGLNPDGSYEVFRASTVPGGPITQVTSLGPLAQQWPYIAGLSVNGDGRVVLVAFGHVQSLSGAPCVAADYHKIKVYYFSLETTAPGVTPNSLIVRPPFDVIGEDGGAPLGCQTAGNVASCLGLIRGSTEATRNILIIPEWTITTPTCAQVIRRQPVPMSLPAGQAALFADDLTLPMGCSAATGDFRLIVISPDVASADRASATSGFTIP